MRITWAAIGSVLTVVLWGAYHWFANGSRAPTVPAPTAAPITPTAAEVFSEIYAQKIWGVNAEGEGRSGSGSTLEATVVYRAFLQNFLAQHKIASVVDAGCGDWECSRAIDWTGIDYRGYDIVEDVIAKNRAKYGSAKIQFFVANVVKEPIPSADLLICKHVLQHLPNRDVKTLLLELGRYKHVLLTNSVEEDTLSAPNHDVELGGYRPLDLTRRPFRIRGTKVLMYWDGTHMQQVLHVRR